MTTSHNSPNTQFGTFGGVFTPCTLTILGVIMFLRFGYVVGQAGVLYALLIVIISKSITLLTSLSLSAIATNTRIRGGGAYYLISRSLGVESGAAIGVVFFFAQAISVAMYVIGFSEAFVAGLPAAGLSLTVVATIVNLLVFACVFVGAGWTIKVQYVILALLIAALVSFYIGALQSFHVPTLQSNLTAHFMDKENFFTMFALFFPAVTGIMAGANMSGDLQNPARSIPLGTLAAVAVTGVIYLSQATLLGGAAPHQMLIANKLAIADISHWPFLITIGVFAATLSSALGSMMGAPRILQAMARDRVFERLQSFAIGSGKSNEPRRAVVVTFAISQAGILLADLNAIAPIITMAFMMTYALLNLATFYEAITQNPSYRPQFRWCHWTTSLLGAVGCLAVMFLIDMWLASISITLMGLLYWNISRREVEARWGDVQSGLLFERARRSLLKLELELHHPKNWRPIILALSGRGWSRVYLAMYGHWFTTGRGILSLGQVIAGDVDDWLARRINQENILYGFIREHELQAFPAVVVSPSLADGIESLVQCHGLGSLRPNMVLLGWPGDPERAARFIATLRTVTGLQCSVVAIRFAAEPDDPRAAPRGTLDVWWRGYQNGELMLLLAYLLTTNNEWRSHTIRVLRVIDNEAGRENVYEHLTQLMTSARIRAIPEVIVDDDVHQAIQRTSRTAALVFMGFDAPKEGGEGDFFTHMEKWAGMLPRVVFVNSAGGMSLET